jgi:cytochrome c oxidase cbb3-type subunit 4
MNLDVEWMRSGMTVVAFATFVGIVLWAWSSRKKGDFEYAARSVLDDDEPVAHDPVINRRDVGHE